MRKKVCEMSLAMVLPLLGLGCADGTGSIAAAGVMAGAPAPVDPQPQPQPQMAAPGGMAALTVKLVDGPLDGLKAMNVEVQKVELIDAQGSATVLASPNRVIDLLKLQGGLSDTLAAVQIEAGSYQGLRLLLGANNSVQLADGSVHALTTPSAQQSGLKVAIDLTVDAGGDHTLVVDFDVAASLQLHTAGHSNKYMLRPALRAVNAQTSGAISGHLSDAASGQPLGGAAVFAETRDANGQPHIVRRVLSAADGSYRLDLLPLGASYLVVSQPVVDGVSYAAKVSDALALTAAASSATFDAQLSATMGSGSLEVQVSPVATDQQSDTCMLLRGDAGSAVIVATQAASVDSAESAQWTQLPPGAYKVQCLRRSSADSSDDAGTLSQPAAAAVSSTAAVAAVSFGS